MGNAFRAYQKIFASVLGLGAILSLTYVWGILSRPALGAMSDRKSLRLVREF
jgi:hypothetical protein